MALLSHLTVLPNQKRKDLGPFPGITNTENRPKQSDPTRTQNVEAPDKGQNGVGR